jgi:hypothetical protein
LKEIYSKEKEFFIFYYSIILYILHFKDMFLLFHNKINIFFNKFNFLLINMKNKIFSKKKAFYL